MPTIFTHGGNAHRDEFIACSIILAKEHGNVGLRWQVSRVLQFNPADATEFDYVVDIGGIYDPNALRFDHHQDITLPCATSLVLKYFKLLDDAYSWYPWVEFTDIVDVKGPAVAAAWLDARVSTLARVFSPVERALLNQFSGVTTVESGSTLYELMVIIGNDIVDGLQLRAGRLSLIESKAVVEWVGNAPAVIYFLDDVPDPELALRMFRFKHARGASIGVVRSTRGEGWRLFRFEDTAGIDFKKVENHPEIEYVHGTGFMATTKTRCSTSTLQELIRIVREKT